MSRIIIALGLCALLTACGGGSTSDSTTPPRPPISYSYDSQLDVENLNDFVAQLETQGAQGMRYVDDMFFLTEQRRGQFFNLFVKTDSKIIYKVFPGATNRAELEQRLNSLGAEGFRWSDNRYYKANSYEIYRKSSDSSETFSYKVMDGNLDTQSTLTQANEQGALGSILVSYPGIFKSDDFINVYEKSSTSSAQYAYEMNNALNNEANAVTLLNTLGSRGYIFKSQWPLKDGVKSLYVKDMTQNATFHYKLTNSSSTITDFLTATKQENAQGYIYSNNFFFGSIQKTVYKKSTSCTGILCGVGPAAYF